MPSLDLAVTFAAAPVNVPSVTTAAVVTFPVWVNLAEDWAKLVTSLVTFALAATLHRDYAKVETHM